MLVAPDSFKGTFSAEQVAVAICAGLSDAGITNHLAMPMADGGEGTAEVLQRQLGGTWMQAATTDPLGRSIKAKYLLLETSQTAVIDVAAATGITLLTVSELDPVKATSFGTGVLIADAVRNHGVKEIYLGCGGSATVDGGRGLLEALAQAGVRPGQVKISCLVDSRAPWEQAAPVFGPQKGADASNLPFLQKRMNETAEFFRKDVYGVALSGGAGGIAGALWSEYNAQLILGAKHISNLFDLPTLMRKSRAVLVGEGRMDATTLTGKLPGELAVDARQMGVQSFAICGQNKLTLLQQRILDLQMIVEAQDLQQIRKAAQEIANYL